MAKIRINALTFSNGSRVDLADVTVIVGPNNSGKTRALVDIETALQGRQFLSQVVGEPDIELPDSFEDLRAQTGLELVDLMPNRMVRGLGPSLDRAHLGTQYAPPFHPWSAVEQAQAHDRSNAFLNNFGFALVARLSTEVRLSMTKAASSGDANSAPDNLLQLLYRTRRGEEHLNRAFVPVFNTRLRLDWSGLSQLVLRVGQDIDRVSTNPQDALHEFKQYPTLDQQGDGMRSFAAVCLGIDVVRRPVTLIDEPESFLHPPQARALGRHIGANAHNRQLIVSTHSTEILRGILSTGKTVRVIRLTRSDNANIPHVIDATILRSLVHDPLLSSARVLDGVFYRGAIVTEADADRAFYEVVASQTSPDSDFHYTHAQSKQTLHRVVATYRKLGVPCASIVDIDILNDGIELKKLLAAHGADDAECAAVLSLRQTIEAAVCAEPVAQRLEKMIEALKKGLTEAQDQSHDPINRVTTLARVCERVKGIRNAWQAVKQGGVDALSANAQLVFTELKERCASHGLFVVPVGELEGWLRGRVPLSEGNKHEWIARALQVLPNLQVKSDEGPWSFIGQVHRYLETLPGGSGASQFVKVVERDPA